MNSTVPSFPNSRFTFWLGRGLILAITALAFFLRVRSLTLFNFHIDEFFTLAAADLIAKSGVPLYPTGLFYDPGLPFSYIDGALFWLLGFSEALGRWPAVIFGTLAVITVYWLGRRVLRSPGVALLAAFWLAISLESVEWSGRARMITLAQWLGLLSVALLWLGLTRASVRHRIWFSLSYGGALLGHFSTVVLMSAWFVVTLAMWKIKVVRFQRALIRDASFLLLIFVLTMASGVIFQPPPSVEFQAANEGLDAKVGVLTNKFLQIPSDVAHAWESYGPYFFQLPHGPVLILALLGLAVSLLRLTRSQDQPRDIGALYLGCIFLTVMLTLTLVINPHWQRSRYLLMQVQGIFLLLGAYGLQEVFLWHSQGRSPDCNPDSWLRYSQIGGATILVLVLSSRFFLLLQLENIVQDDATGWNRYDQAFGHVRENFVEGDKVISMHPPASLLYLNQSDYYLVQSSPKLIVRPDGAIGDRYTGANWLKTADEFSNLITNSDRVWLVTQEFWLFNSYDGYLQQQILWQMDKMWGEGGVWALASRSGTWPLAQKPDTILNAEFDRGARLLGFSADPSRPIPGNAVRLTLFWQGQIPQLAKVFVHLRDANNSTVAQADHFIYDGKVPTSRWPTLIDNDTVIRDGAALLLPQDLTAGTYRVVVGFYHPETFERLGVIDDRSGESAVVLGEWTIASD